jgi:hypothetical protein
MFFPTLPVEIRKQSGHDLYGQPKWTLPVREMVAPIRVEQGSRNTTVRTDSGATHGHAQETESKIGLMFKPGSLVERGDRVDFLGRRLRVVTVHDRFTVAGQLHHKQVELETWA